ncbi:MAG: dTMP kinase [Candidatus Diapherotrites archaeon]|uniref:Probable thymidylate kinase n=1 Tax=Candidatus Iainarchaeum sp. TaxID=3101447 RepID=A0A8T4KVN0_9ARCH|nr:dTMP kinase [Candidatus Diapherotrites archaeon]
MNGKIIVIEGADASGKSTQAEILSARLKKIGKNARVISFPRHNEFFGSLVERHLRGKFGNPHELPAEFCALLYSVDRYNMLNEIKNALKEGKILIMDRYVQSNFAFQTAKFSNLSEQDSFLQWMQTVESRMPKADAVILLEMPAEFSQRLLKKEGKKKDLHESNVLYQKRVLAVYERLARSGNWLQIKCAFGQQNGKWKLKSKKQIAEEIWNGIKNRI